jgi:cbb3-type cytochrome oxidase cytochrome c subunit
VRWRNNLAHGGDDERTITVEELDAVVALLRTLGMEIDLAAQEI